MPARPPARTPEPSGADDTCILHATTVSHQGRGVVILGRSGSGKSGLALSLMAFGAVLVADDRTILDRRDGALIARCPEPLLGRIEARGIGILRAVPGPAAPVALAIRLDRTETARLPERRSVTWLGVTVPLFHKVESPYFHAAILQYLAAGRSVP